MKSKYEFYTDIKEGAKFQKNVRELFFAALLTFVGKRVHIIIEIVRNTRSDRQNRYYWGVVVPEQADCLHERWGVIWDKEQVHDWNKNNIWHTELINEETGEIIKQPGSSKAKTVGEFEERLEKLRQQFQSDWDWHIPLPNEQTELL